MSPEKWLKRNLKSKCITIDALPEALYNFERAELKKSFAKRSDSLSRLKLANNDLYQRQEILQKELNIKLEKLKLIGRATLFRLMKGSTIKESTLSRLEAYFDDKLFDNKLNFVKNAPMVKDERTCKFCGFSNRKAHPDNWLRKEVDVEQTQIPTIHKAFLSTHRNKLFSGLLPRKYVMDKSLDKSERKKKQLAYSRENRNKYFLYICSACLTKATNTLQSNYSTLTNKILSDKNWNQQALANRLKVGQSVISRIKNGDIEFLQPKIAEEIHLVALCELSNKIISYRYSYTYDDYSEAFHTLKMYGYSLADYIFKYQIENKDLYSHQKLPDLGGCLRFDLLIASREYNCYFGCSFSGLHPLRVMENIDQLKRSMLSHVFYFDRYGEKSELTCFQLYPLIETDLPFANGHLKTRSLRDKDDYQELDKSLSTRINSYHSKASTSTNSNDFYTAFFDVFTAELAHTFYSSPVSYSQQLIHSSRLKNITDDD